MRGYQIEPDSYETVSRLSIRDKVLGLRRAWCERPREEMQTFVPLVVSQDKFRVRKNLMTYFVLSGRFAELNLVGVRK